MKNKILKLTLLPVIGIMILGGCAQQAKIGFLMDESKTGRWTEDKSLFIKHVEDKGGDVILEASEGDAERQYELAKKILNAGIDVLVIIPTDRTEAAKIVKLAHEKDVPVIAYDRIIWGCDLDFYVSFDSQKVGQLQAEYMTNLCPEGKYVILKGPHNDQNTFFLSGGYDEVLQPLVDSGKISIVYDEHVLRWNTEEGYQLMKKCLEDHQDIDVVIASNDQLAEGAIRAIKEAGITDLPLICGQDAEPSALTRIEEGEQTMTVEKPIRTIAEKAADVAMKLAEDEEVTSKITTYNGRDKPVETILLDPLVIPR